jgi:hypothetical protein
MKGGALRRCVADAGGTAQLRAAFSQVNERPVAIDFGEPPGAETVCMCTSDVETSRTNAIRVPSRDQTSPSPCCSQ